MRLLDQLIRPPTNLQECHRVMKQAAHDNARLRSMLFQFVDGGDTPEFRGKVMDLLGIHQTVEVIPARITDDLMFHPGQDEN